MKFRRHFLSRIYRNSDPDADGGGGGFADTSSTVDAGLDTPASPAAPAAGTEGSDKPGTMLEAMFGQAGKAAPTEAEAAEAAATGKTVAQLRDEKGRFAAGKAPDAQVQGQQPDPNKKVDPTQMPEGLTPKAQERFQALANTNKELAGKVQEYEPIVQSALGLQEVFKSNGVKREQFEQAMEVVGLMNRGDLEGALRVLDEQRRLISVHLGRPLPGADALADHPDLRAEVDNLQITEARALEIARGRMQQQQHQRQHTQQQQELARQQQEERQVQAQQTERNNAIQAVDRFCKQMQATDLDFARIEPILLKEIEDGLFEGVPFAARPALVQKTYNLIKQTASQTRTSGATPGVLRPSGMGEGVKQQPKSMYEAQWGTAKPAGM